MKLKFKLRNGAIMHLLSSAIIGCQEPATVMNKTTVVADDGQEKDVYEELSVYYVFTAANQFPVYNITEDGDTKALINYDKLVEILNNMD